MSQILKEPYSDKVNLNTYYYSPHVGIHKPHEQFFGQFNPTCILSMFLIYGCPRVVKLHLISVPIIPTGT